MTIHLRLILVCVLLLVLPPACHKPTEEDKVKRIVTDIQKAAGEKGIRTILDHVSKSYRDPQGYDFEGIKGLLAYYFFRHLKVSVFIPSIEVLVGEGAARAKFQAILSGGSRTESAGTLLPEALGVYDFDVSLAKEGSEWKATSAAWRRTGDAPYPAP